MKPRISAVILTFNEEHNIASALRSVASWVDEIIVVDMHSVDRTVEIAESFNAKVLFHPQVGFQDPARSFAMDQASGDWIINIDADEIVSVELSARLVAIAENDTADICSIPRLNYFGGRPMLHSGWNPNRDRQLRFFKCGALLFSPRIHARPTPAPGKRIVQLKYPETGALIHFNYLNAEQFLDKLNRYTGIEANQMLARGQDSGPIQFLVKPTVEFLKRFVLFRGFQDGWSGFYYCCLMFAYKATAAFKLWELRQRKSEEEVRRHYAAIIDDELSRSKISIAESSDL